MLILTTKLHMPPLRARHVSRPRLAGQLAENADRKLILVSAPAGFGKTTAVCEWLAHNTRPASWLSLDDNDNDPARFLSYLVAALQKIQPDIGQGLLPVLQAPQPPPLEVMLTALLNEIAELAGPFTLILDDYHVITAQAIDAALTFVLENAPPQLHVVIITREDPRLALHKLRARDDLAELRAADLRFTRAEAADFLIQSMGLRLSTQEIAALEARTEGWIVGLQLAAISMQGVDDKPLFVQTFAGSHRYILDYLLEEVLHKQPESVQQFLLNTSILERMCGALCDTVLAAPAGSGQKTLEYLEQANLFIIPLDNERRWYRYHHLFAELMRQRLKQHSAEGGVNPLHIRASEWYEANGFDLDAFRHAAAANDIERADRLIEGDGLPLHMRGAVTTVLNWLASLPPSAFEARPSLWWRHGSLLLVNGQTTGVEEKLNAADAAIADVVLDDKTRHLVGRIATARAVLALTRYQVEQMLVQSRRALVYLNPDSLGVRANAHWTLGYAHFFRGDMAAARQSFLDAIDNSEKARATFTTILATIGLGNVYEFQNEFRLAAHTFRRVLQLAGDQPLQIVHTAHLGLARVLYEWNDLAAAEHHAEQSLQLARQYDQVIDRFIICELVLAKVKLARGDVAGAAAGLARADEAAHQPRFAHRLPEVALAQAQALLHQRNMAGAMRLAQLHALPLIEAQVQLAEGNADAALALLDTVHQTAITTGRADEALDALAWQAVAWHKHGDPDKALHALAEVLALAEPQGFIRLFVDKGEPMAHLLAGATTRGMRVDYIGQILAAFQSVSQPAQTLVEPLSARELEVLRLIAQGLSNNDIGERLFLALDTVKGHNRKIFEKLGVQRRTEAVAQARHLGLL